MDTYGENLLAMAKRILTSGLGDDVLSANPGQANYMLKALHTRSLMFIFDEMRWMPAHQRYLYPPTPFSLEDGELYAIVPALLKHMGDDELSEDIKKHYAAWRGAFSTRPRYWTWLGYWFDQWIFDDD